MVLVAREALVASKRFVATENRGPRSYIGLIVTGSSRIKGLVATEGIVTTGVLLVSGEIVAIDVIVATRGFGATGGLATTDGLVGSVEVVAFICRQCRLHKD